MVGSAMTYDMTKCYQKILARLLNRGYEKEAPASVIVPELKKAFNLVETDTAKKYLKTMSEFGYVEEKSGGIWKLNHNDIEDN